MKVAEVLQAGVRLSDSVARLGGDEFAVLLDRADQRAAEIKSKILCAGIGAATLGAVGVSSGTEALALALRALEIGPGDEVIVPTNSFIATAEAVSAVGATPLLVDVDPDSHLLSAEIVAALKKVYDPEMPVNIYELGLIYDLTVDDAGATLISMTLTAPNCPVAGSLPAEVERAAQRRLDAADEFAVVEREPLPVVGLLEVRGQDAPGPPQQVGDDQRAALLQDPVGCGADRTRRGLHHDPRAHAARVALGDRRVVAGQHQHVTLALEQLVARDPLRALEPHDRAGLAFVLQKRARLEAAAGQGGKLLGEIAEHLGRDERPQCRQVALAIGRLDVGQH